MLSRVTDLYVTVSPRRHYPIRRCRRRTSRRGIYVYTAHRSTRFAARGSSCRGTASRVQGEDEVPSFAGCGGQDGSGRVRVEVFRWICIICEEVFTGVWLDACRWFEGACNHVCSDRASMRDFRGVPGIVVVLQKGESFLPENGCELSCGDEN